MAAEKKDGLLWKIITLFATAFSTIALGVMAHAVSVAHDLETRITAMEAGNFTSRDAHTLWSELSKLKERIPEKIPPEWLRKQIDKLEDKVENLEKEVRRR